MKKVTSTTGQKIPFTLTAEKKFIFDPIVPTQVEDVDFEILERRLGSQLRVLDTTTSSPVTASAPTDTVTSDTVASTATISDADEDGEPKDVE